jgi:hypothetical protein
VEFSSASGLCETYRYLFRGCVEAHYRCGVVAHFSLDDTFIDYGSWQAAGEPKGFVWGVNWADAWPGWTYLGESERATEWACKLGVAMHEVLIETNTYTLALVFADLAVTKVGERWVPPSTREPSAHSGA